MFFNFSTHTTQAAEVASRIQQKKEMGCKTLDVFHADQGSGTENKILRTLGGGSVNLSGSYFHYRRSPFFIRILFVSSTFHKNFF